MNETGRMHPGSASDSDVPSGKNLIRTVSSWLMLIALVWLLAPSSQYQFHINTLEPEPAGYATEQISLGIGPASFLSLHREGTGLAAEGPRHLDWQAYELSFHPHPLALLPLVLILLSIWMRTQSAHHVVVSVDGWVERLKPRAALLASTVSTGLVSGFVAATILALLLPMAHEAVLERADVEQLKTRLAEQLATGKQGYRLRLELPETGPTQLVVRRYSWTVARIDDWETLVQATELERRDLNQFRFKANPVVMPLALGVGLIVFGLSLRRRLRLPVPAG